MSNMSKIDYHKNAHRHGAASKAKRMLQKIITLTGNGYVRYYTAVQITGVSDLDANQVYDDMRRWLKEFERQIQTAIHKNEKFLPGTVEYNPDYDKEIHVSKFEYMVDILKRLEAVRGFILESYPVLPTRRIEFVFTATGRDEKWKEANRFFADKVNGFCQEWFVVHKNGEAEKLHVYSILNNQAMHNLSDAEKMYVEFI